MCSSDLDNASVIEAVHDIIRFWARTGVDGFRLDAVSYLTEREMTVDGFPFSPACVV